MLPARSPRENTLRILTTTNTARTLRVHLARHNLRVILLAFATLLLSIGFWVLLYGLTCWLILLVVSMGGDTDYGIPRAFLRWFIALALISVALTWLFRRFMPPEIARDKKPVAEIALDFLLAVPRVTLSFFAMLSAWRHLTSAEFNQAATFIHRLADERRLPLPSVPQEIPEAHARDRILLTLQIMQIIDLQKRDRDWFVTLHVSRPPAFQFDRSGEVE